MSRKIEKCANAGNIPMRSPKIIRDTVGDTNRNERYLDEKDVVGFEDEVECVTDL
jgi:hypothetical protein